MTDKKETIEKGDFSPEGTERVLKILEMNFGVSDLTVTTHTTWEFHADAYSDPQRWEKLVIYDSEGEILFGIKRDLN